MNAPTDADLRRQLRYKTWRHDALNWQCPWGCGGRTKKDCEKYGDSGTHIASRPTKEELIEIKKAREKRRRKAELRAAKAKNKSL